MHWGMAKTENQVTFEKFDKQTETDKESMAG